MILMREDVLEKETLYRWMWKRSYIFFDDRCEKFSRISSNKTFSLSYLLKRRSEFAQNSPLYLETGGMHGACIIRRRRQYDRS